MTDNGGTMKSWDAWANTGELVDKIRFGDFTIPVRVVPWECPYPQEQVPQVGEKAARGDVLTPPFRGRNKEWYVVTLNRSRGSSYMLVESILKVPAPTVELPNGKTYLASEVMERCKELEPVDA